MVEPLRLERVDHGLDVLRPLTGGHQYRVGGVDHHDVLEPDHRDGAAGGRDHDPRGLERPHERLVPEHLHA